MTNDPTTNQEQTPATEPSSSMLNDLVNTLTNALNNVTGSSDNEEDASRSLSYIPRTDFGVLTGAKYVIPKWQEWGVKLEYTNPTEFAMLVDVFEVKLASGRSAKAERTPTVDRLKQLRAMIDQNIGKIKDLLSIDYNRKSAPSHYPSFGITKVGSTYTLPTGYDETVRALEVLLKGLDTYGYADHKYGRTFWLDIYNEYLNLSTKNRALTGSSSLYSGDKNVLKEQVTRVLRSLFLMIQANYPDTWPHVAREWGYLRERY